MLVKDTDLYKQARPRGTAGLCAARSDRYACEVMVVEALLINYLKRETIRYIYTQESTYLSPSNVTACVGVCAYS